MEPTAADYQEEFDAWYKNYEIDTFIEYSEENWEKVQKMDTHYIWTNHSTCEDEQVSAGGSYFKNGCCWDTFGWYVAKKPWAGDPENHYESYKTTAYLVCESCNADGEEENLDPDCEYCEGEGYVNHFFD